MGHIGFEEEKFMILALVLQTSQLYFHNKNINVLEMQHVPPILKSFSHVREGFKKKPGKLSSFCG